MPCPPISTRVKSVENIPPECFQNYGTASGTQGGAVLFAPPSKSCRFSHPPSPCARSMARRISLSVDSDLEGTCPLRTPRQLRSAGAAFSGKPFWNLLVSARCFLCSVRQFQHRTKFLRSDKKRRSGSKLLRRFQWGFRTRLHKRIHVPFRQILLHPA